MSTVLEAKPQAQDNLAEISCKLAFQKQLQAVTNRIHATSNIDEIMLELAQDICSLFDADRLTIYVTERGPARRSSRRSRPASTRSRTSSCRSPSSRIAGFVARQQAAASTSATSTTTPSCKRLQPAPALPEGGRQAHRLPHQADAGGAGRRRATQRADRRDPAHQHQGGQPFSAAHGGGRASSCARRSRSPSRSARSRSARCSGKYDYLVTNAVLSAEELELATALGAPQEPRHRRRC